VLASCGMLGGAVAPMLAGVLGQVNLRSVFLATAVAYLLALALAVAPLLRRNRQPTPEPAADIEVETSVAKQE
jgi:hypothetical protein